MGRLRRAAEKPSPTSPTWAACSSVSCTLSFCPSVGLAYGASERYFGVRNSYYRWKRRRAARKFEVYMRKHNRTVSGTFDEHGNYIPPDDVDKKNGGSKSGWVN